MRETEPQKSSIFIKLFAGETKQSYGLENTENLKENYTELTIGEIML